MDGKLYDSFIHHRSNDVSTGEQTLFAMERTSLETQLNLLVCNPSELKRRKRSVGSTSSLESIGTESDSTSSQTPPTTPQPWSATSARFALIKYRSRKAARQHSKTIIADVAYNVHPNIEHVYSNNYDYLDNNRLPSPLIKRVLDYQYDISTKTESTSSQRVLAVMYCLFYGAIVSLYYSLTNGGYRRSLLAWCIACLAVSSLVMISLIIATICVHYINMVVLSLLESVTHFFVTLFVCIVLFLSALAMFSFTTVTYKNTIMAI